MKLKLEYLFCLIRNYCIRNVRLDMNSCSAFIYYMYVSSLEIIYHHTQYNNIA